MTVGRISPRALISERTSAQVKSFASEGIPTSVPTAIKPMEGSSLTQRNKVSTFSFSRNRFVVASNGFAGVANGGTTVLIVSIVSFAKSGSGILQRSDVSAHRVFSPPEKLTPPIVAFFGKFPSSTANIRAVEVSSCRLRVKITPYFSRIA